MRASLPMYLLPEVADATARWWQGLAARLRAAGVDGVPAGLSAAEDREVLWRAPDLLLSQTCGYPLTHALSGVVEPLATPAYAAPGCAGYEYASMIVVPALHRATRLEELRGSICAVNGTDSHSGYNVLRFEIAPLTGGHAFFSRVVVTGSHVESIALVARGEAQICAVDCVTHALLARYRPDALAATRVLMLTRRAPGLPYVTRAGLDNRCRARMRRGLEAAFADDALAPVREALLIDGVAWLDVSDYRPILDMERAAEDARYPTLR